MIEPSDSMTFAYHRAVAPLMWVFVCVASVELVVVHLLLAMWRPWVALAASLMSLATIGWLVAAIASFRRLPVLLDARRLTMRVGTIKCAEVARSDIAEVHGEMSRDALKQAGAANFALIAHPNVVVSLRTPVRVRGREVRALAHRLDDPAEFFRAFA